MSSNLTRFNRSQLLLNYWHILEKRRVAVFVFMGLFIGTVAIASMTATRYYSSTAVLEIAPKAPVAFDLSEVNELVATPSPSTLRFYYFTQYRIIQSRTVMTAAVKRLREEYGAEDFDEKPDPPAYLKSIMSVEPEIDTHLVKISFTHSDPEKAALFANTVGEVYIRNNLDRALEATIEAEKWLETRQEEYRLKKIATDGQIQNFKSEAGIVGLDKQQSTASSSLERLRQAWSEAHTQRVQVEAEYKEMSRLSKSGDQMALVNYLSRGSSILQEMSGRLRRLQQTRSQLEARYKEQWPELRQLDAEMSGLEEQIRREVNETVDARQAEYQIVRQKEESLAEELAITKGQVEEIERKLIQLNILETEAERNGSLFKSLDLRRSRVGLAKVMEANNITFMDRALPSYKVVKPQVATNLLMAVVFGVVGGCLFAFALEYLDSSVRGRDDIENIVGVPFLGVVPLAAPAELQELKSIADRNILAYSLPRSGVAESLRSIRTNVLFRLPKEFPRIILVTSASPQEGKSFISSNLATIIAMTGSRVLLVDADMRRPTVHKLFDLDNRIGLAELLAETSSVEDVTIHSHVPGLDLILAGQTPSNPAELLEGGRLHRLLGTLTNYDIMVIDSPPVNAVADPVVLASHSSGVVFVVQNDRTRRANVVHARERLTEVQANILGAVINKVQVRKAGYGYYYYYSHYNYYYSDAESAPRASGEPVEGASTASEKTIGSA